MSPEHLRQTLEELHRELETTREVDERSRELLGEVMQDIRGVLERAGEGEPAEEPGLIERLREATRHFEDAHPALANAAGRVADALSNLGI